MKRLIAALIHLRSRIAAPVLALPLLLAAPVLPAIAQDGSYLIRPGDTLQIEILEDPGLNRSVLVSPDGRIALPLAGAFRASGKTIEEVQDELAGYLTPNFAARPNVYVSIQRIAERTPSAGAMAPAMIDIYVIGEGEDSGKLSVTPGTTVLQLFAQMGGFSRFAATKRIELRRTDRQTGAMTRYNINYDAIMLGTSRIGDTVLFKDDVIVIPQRKLFE